MRQLANSGIPRDESFVTTKLWVLVPGGEDNAKRASRPRCNGSASTT